MKHYPFPMIHTLDDLRLAFEGREEIKVMDRGDYYVVDYLYVLPDTFPSIPDDASSPEWRLAVLRRECRGIMFRKDGTLLSRRLHKFFNMGEREEMLPENIDFSKPHRILNKEDGSMLSPFLDPQDQVKWVFEQAKGYTQRVFWGTMMGWTDVAQAAETFIAGVNQDYEGFARSCLQDDWTPIFEWCSPESRIVLKHERAKLTLLTIRNNQTGMYKTYAEASAMADAWGIPMVESFGSVDGSAKAFMERVREETDTEGYVVQFDDGHCMKLKTAWYLRFHKAKENLVFEKDVINLIMAGDVDDVMPVLMEHDRIRLEQYQEELADVMSVAARNLAAQVGLMRGKVGSDRGAYAGLVKTNVDLPGPLKAMAFKLFQDDGTYSAGGLIRDYVASSTGSKSTVDEMRKIVPVQPW
jgi:RNA ligase